MSIIEECKEANALHKQETKNAAQEHMAELERQRVESETYVNPLLIAFKKKRAAQAVQNKVLLPRQQK